jgi:hypothetical protein
MRYLACVVLGALLMVAPGVALADDAPEPTPAQIRAAAEAFDRGREAYKDDEFLEAAEQFERADANAPSTTALELALRSREKAGNADRAATLAALALSRHPEHDGLQKLATEILKRRRGELFQLAVSCAEPCELVADSKIVHGARALERTVYLLPGQHSVVAGFGEGRTATQSVEAAAGGSGELAFEAPAQPTAAETPATTTTTTTEPAPVVDTPPKKESSGWSPAVFWTGAAVTAAAGAFTIWSGVDTLNDPGADYVRDLCAEEGENGPNCQSAYNEGRDKQFRTNIAIGATAVLGVATILIGAFATDWSGGSDEAARLPARRKSALPDVRVAPWAALDGGGLGASGRF